MLKLKGTFGIESLATRQKRSLLRLMYIHNKFPINIQDERKYITLGSGGKIKLKLAYRN